MECVIVKCDPNGPWADVCFLFDDQRAPVDRPCSLLFERPVARIVAPCGSGSALGSALAAIEQEGAKGRHVCGYIAYEAGNILADEGQSDRDFPAESGSPWLDFFSFEAPLRLTGVETSDWVARRAPDPRCAVYGIERTETRDSYRAKIATIKEFIRSGDTYQVNFTYKYRFGFDGSGIELYRVLRDRQRAPLGAYARLPEQEILSLSPELFLQHQCGWLTSKPMKGTAPRGPSPEEDAAVVERLRNDPKTRSENVMIVDLVRSDIGRVAETGTVSVDHLFEVETFETLHQLVSTIRGKVRPGTGLPQILSCLFPCGSITGAPKLRTMQILRSLEAEPRGLYTGALGFIAPDKSFRFSVPIRTLLTRDGRGEMGVGSGVIAESDADDEFDECALKARFLLGINSSFSLIESMRFDAADGHALHLDAHLNRLEASATFFQFEFDRTLAIQTIEGATAACFAGVHKLRLTLSQGGAIGAVTEAVTEGTPSIPWIAVSDRRIDSESCFQRHKTTARKLYDDEYARYRACGAYDVVFFNERGELAESSRHNVFVEINGTLVTPPVSAGALPGIKRQQILEDPAYDAKEGTVSLAELTVAARILLTNAVRGVVQVVLKPITALDRAASSERT